MMDEQIKPPEAGLTVYLVFLAIFPCNASHNSKSFAEQYLPQPKQSSRTLRVKSISHFIDNFDKSVLVDPKIFL